MILVENDSVSEERALDKDFISLQYLKIWKIPGDLFFDGVFFPFLGSLRVGVLVECRLLLQLWFVDIDSFCMDWLHELMLTLELFLNEALNEGFMFSLLLF